MGKLIFSTGSMLSYIINERYYGGIHYVWCSPKFDCHTNPPSSNPRLIMQNYLTDIKQMDKHSSIISQNRYGMKKGAEEMCSTGVISDNEKKI